MSDISKQPLDLVPLAERFKVNIGKSLFPLNSLRIFYLMLVRDLTDGNETALEMMNAAVPKISAVADACDNLHPSDLSPAVIHGKLTETREALLSIIDTPALRYDFEVIWEQQLVIQYLKNADHIKQLVSTNDTKTLPFDVFLQLLDMRSIDHFLYAQVVYAIVSTNGLSTAIPYHPLKDTPTVLRQCIKTIQQINDLVDAVCYAHQDLEAQSGHLIKFIMTYADTPQQRVSIIREILMTLQQDLQGIALSSPAYQNVQTYAAHLIGVLDGMVYDGR